MAHAVIRLRESGSVQFRGVCGPLNQLSWSLRTKAIGSVFALVKFCN